MSTARDAQSDLWAITCLFGVSSPRRIENYWEFRNALRLPLVTVELSFGEPFALDATASEVLVQLQGGDVMWQKERLLSLALARLPDCCTKVVWCDADIIAPDPSWPLAISNALDEAPLVQGFAEVLHLPPRIALPASEDIQRHPSTMFALSCGGTVAETLDSALNRTGTSPCPGHVWAARRDVVERFGLYDGCIIGGGDTAVVSAALGHPEVAIELHAMGEAQAQRYALWAQRFYAETRGQITFVPQTIHHLWHGSMESRRARQRHRGLSALGFDPYSDLRLSPRGVWQWSSERPELHRYLREYFESRGGAEREGATS